MNITQVNHLYRPSIGGIENYSHRLSLSLRESGHDVSVLTTTDSFRNEASPLEAEDWVTYCDTTFSLFRNPFSLNLYRAVRNSDADVYHLHSPFFFPTVEAVHALAEDDAPVVLTIHGFPPTGGLVKAARNLVYDPVVQYVLDNVDTTIVLGESEKARVCRTYDVPDSAVRVIPNGIHPDRYDVPEAAVEDFRERVGVDPSTPTILAVCRLVEVKNPDVLVETVVDHLPNIDLDVLIVGTGEGPYVQNLKAKADDRVKFVSNLSATDLKAAYHASDLFVNLAASEGLPTVLLEAMNARLPVVATAVGAVPDVVRAENGITVRAPPAPWRVAEAIREFVDDPERRREVGSYNRQCVRTEYDWPSVAARIEATYEELLDGRRDRRGNGRRNPRGGGRRAEQEQWSS